MFDILVATLFNAWSRLDEDDESLRLDVFALPIVVFVESRAASILEDDLERLALVV